MNTFRHPSHKDHDYHNISTVMILKGNANLSFNYFFPEKMSKLYSVSTEKSRHLHNFTKHNQYQIQPITSHHTRYMRQT